MLGHVVVYGYFVFGYYEHSARLRLERLFADAAYYIRLQPSAAASIVAAAAEAAALATRNQEMNSRIATRTDLPESGSVRMSVNENRLSDLSVLNPGDIDRMLCWGWARLGCEVDGRIVAFAMADSRRDVYALFVEPSYERAKASGAAFHNTMMDRFFGAGVPKCG